MKRKIEKLENTTGILDSEFNNLIAGLTGVASSTKKELVLSIGKVLQRARSIGLLRSLIEEWNALTKKGLINEDYQKSDQHYECLQELLDYLDSKQLNKDQFDIFKKILFKTATLNPEERDNLLPQQFL